MPRLPPAWAVGAKAVWAERPQKQTRRLRSQAPGIWLQTSIWHEISTCVGASGQDRKWPKRVAPSQRLKLRNLCVVRARVSQELKPLGVQSFECECRAVHIAGQRVMRDSSRCAAWQFVQSSQAGSNDTYCQEVGAVQLEQWQDCLAATRLAAKKSKNHASLFRTTSSVVATPEYKVWE